VKLREKLGNRRNQYHPHLEGTINRGARKWAISPVAGSRGEKREILEI